MNADWDDRLHEQLLGDVDSLLSSWALVEEHPEFGPDQALSVLATWSHLQRFSPALLDQRIVDRLSQAVQSDAAKLIERFSELTFVEGWIEDSKALDESWDWILDNDAADEAHWSAICFFEALDRYSLACHASRRLLPEGSEMPEGLRALIEEVSEGEDFLRDHPDIYLGAAVIASAGLAQYRDDLHEVDEPLWETTLKHRVLEEILEERDAEPTQKLTRREIEELFQAAQVVEFPFQGERPAEIMSLSLNRFFGERSLRAAAATNGDPSLNEERLQIAELSGCVDGDQDVRVRLIPELLEGRRSGLMIRVLGRQENVGRYVVAVVSLGSTMESWEIPLAHGAGTLGDAESMLSQTDEPQITLHDQDGGTHPVRW